MNCIFCGGKIEQKMVIFNYEENNKYLFVENVPAEVCTQCGEKTYSPEVTKELLKFAQNEFKPVKTITVPVFDFAVRT
jgi:YgiT-type zinc finger domain-containing protein